MRQGTDGRRSDLDWMRLALVLAVVPLGCARALGLAQGPASGAAGLAAAAQKAVLWIMPLFFMVSAGSARHALDKLWTRGFLVARVLRPFVPLVVAALVLGACSAVGIVPVLPGTPKILAAGGWGVSFYALVFLASFLLHGEQRLIERAAWQAPAGLKLAPLFAATFLVVAALYAAVRRVTVLRFCFGLTPLPADTQRGSP